MTSRRAGGGRASAVVDAPDDFADAADVEIGEELPDPELEELRTALEEQRQHSLRLMGDFDTFRRRVAREQAEQQLQGRRAALLPMLGVLDTLERALAAGSSDPVFYEGVAATQRQLEAALRDAGAEPLSAVGSMFDPHVHEAVGTLADEGLAPGTVAREVQRGWRLGDELLRPARVVVATAVAEEAQ